MEKRQTAKDIKRKTQEYFSYCESERKPPTVSGLAFCLGFCTKEALLSFNAEERLNYEIQRALLLLESKLEEALYYKDSFPVAKLVLSTQFGGWREKEEKSQAPVYIIDDVEQIGHRPEVSHILTPPKDTATDKQ